MDVITILVLTLFTVVIGTYLFVKNRYSYWQRRGVYYLQPKFPYGHAKPIIAQTQFFGDLFQEFYKHFKNKGLKGGGVFMLIRPVYVTVDIELIKCILQKDFGHFVNHGRKFDKKVDPLSGHLFNLENEEWKHMRVKLTPTFTPAKMKMMFETFVACTVGLVDILKDYSIIQDPVDIKDVVSRFTTDIIGSCAFGVDCNSLKNPNSEFLQYGKKIFQVDPSFKTRIKNVSLSILPRAVVSLLRLKRLDGKVESFFLDLVKNTVNYRDKNKIKRNDFMQLLLQLRNEGKVEDEELKSNTTFSDGETISLPEMAAQCFVFFLAGFETSATTMTFTLLELCLNPEIQNKLRNEIVNVLENHGGTVSYEAVMQMTYLDKVIHETLRKHSPAAGISRSCNKAYRIEGTDTVLEYGTSIHIPVQAIHNDPEYYHEPEKFDPERFNEENKSKRPAFAFLAFGEGPRNCIGARFGLLQAKVGILTIIRHFKVTLNEKTKTPITHATNAFITGVNGGVWINVEPFVTL